MVTKKSYLRLLRIFILLSIVILWISVAVTIRTLLSYSNAVVTRVPANNLFTKIREIEVRYPDRRQETIIYSNIKVVRVMKIKNKYNASEQYKLVIEPVER